MLLSHIVPRVRLYIHVNNWNNKKVRYRKLMAHQRVIRVIIFWPQQRAWSTVQNCSSHPV